MAQISSETFKMSGNGNNSAICHLFFLTMWSFVPEAQIRCSAAVLASAQSSPVDDLTDGSDGLGRYCVSCVLSFTVQLVVL